MEGQLNMENLPATINTDPEYVATVDDLQQIFPKLPDANKARADTIKVGVMCTFVTHSAVLNRSGVSVEHTSAPQKLTQIEFKKFYENGKAIWIYEGKIKHKDSQ